MFKFRKDKQHAPFNITVDVTSGCSIRCSFCGVKGVYSKAGVYDHMSLKTGRLVARKLNEAGWICRITIGCFGEPTENPHLKEIVRAIRKAAPKHSIMMLSNGSGLVKHAQKKFEELHNAGLNAICIEDYRKQGFLQKIRKQGVQFAGRYPNNKKLNPQQRFSVNKHLNIIINDLRDNSGRGSSHSHINNHCCCGGPPNNRGVGKRCTRPFRDFVIRWNGFVPGCCNDWRMKYVVGDIRKHTFEQLWQSQGFYALRQKMYAGERDFGPCNGCDLIGTRVGLLPDPTGQMEMEPPNSLTERVLQQCMRHPDMTPVNLRAWEQ